MTTAPAAPAAPVTSGGPAGAVRAPLGPADVAAAAARIAGHVRRTPLLPGLPAPDLHRTGRRLLLKAEHLQYGGSFKLRGAANAVLALGARRIVTGSSGNHGIALARLAAALGAEVTVVLAGGAHPAKIALIRALGGRTLGVPGGVAERDARARALAEETGAVLVPSSDHELVVAGQGTVGLEILAEVPDAETVYVPTGGGGLLAGVCLAAYGHPVRVVGVEPAGSPRYARSLAAGHPVRLAPGDTVADGLRGQQPGAVPYPVIRDRVDDLVTVSDAEILAAAALLRRRGIEAEPSGAVALAGAMRAGRGSGRAVAVVSGGNTTAALTAAAAAAAAPTASRTERPPHAARTARTTRTTPTSHTTPTTRSLLEEIS
ncbi:MULTISPECIES: threonine ammonia-lyase [unclassified Streptomyces]|uniref:threonine ammonia-lyase n=1 Tax=unclassified Streptomyces TaxID=2593676 RepID=UPI002E0D35BE|nr:pyridoxal-phosphate dependent enzyme [Streptomyces sp. NBC_01296]WSW62510.1 pyridoxal-phosphate dependent enzyme [Streptomyces sp. NBC_00998]